MLPTTPSARSGDYFAPLSPQRALRVGGVDEPEEREADAFADRVIRTVEPGLTSAPGTPRLRALESPVTVGAGEALPAGERAFFEPRLGVDLSDVRVHTGRAAGDSAHALDALAYTVGRDVVFAPGQWRPGETAGRRLLAHELAHVAAGDVGTVRRQQAPGGSAGTQAVNGPPQPDATLGYLESLVLFVSGQINFVTTILQVAAVPAIQQASPLQRANRVLNQGVVRSHLANAKNVAQLNLMQLAPNTTERTRLRTLMVQLITALQRAANLALTVSERMDTATRDAERVGYVETLAQLAEATPMTSGGLAGGDLSAAPATEHLAWLRQLLDDLATRLPQMGLNQAQRDQQYERLQLALRRAMLTVGSDAAGNTGVVEIADAALRQRYREVVALLVSGRTVGTQPTLITHNMPVINLPNPIPASSIAGLTVDLAGVAPDEADAVRYGVEQVLGIRDSSGAPIAQDNTIWTVVLPVRRGSSAVQIRHELTFVSRTRVRAERLGEAVARPVAPDFSALSIAEKKARMVTDFGLAAVDDRPAHGARAAATWTDAELGQVFTVFQRMTAAARTALRGVTLVRDHAPLTALRNQANLPAGATLDGFAHSGTNAPSDTPGPPAHGPPHIHYFDTAFVPGNTTTGVGPAGGSGPGGDFLLLHEVGHQLIFVAMRAANAEIAASNTRNTAAINAYNNTPGRNGAPQSQTIQALRGAWQTARTTAFQAILGVNQGVVSTPPAADLDVRLATATTARAARDAARQAYVTSGVSAAVVAAVNEVDAADDALLTASIRLRAANGQITAFRALANRFGLSPITAYAATADGEFFAETFALFASDPDRLNAMNPRMFQWFMAGMPMDAAWNPP